MREFDIKQTTAKMVEGRERDKAAMNGLPCEAHFLGATRGGHLYQFKFYTACRGGLWVVDADLNDFEKLAVLTIEEIQRDGAYFTLVDASEDERNTMIMDYMVDAVRRHESFAMAYKKNKGFRQGLQKAVMALL